MLFSAKYHISFPTFDLMGACNSKLIMRPFMCTVGRLQNLWIPSFGKAIYQVFDRLASSVLHRLLIIYFLLLLNIFVFFFSYHHLALLHPSGGLETLSDFPINQNLHFVLSPFSTTAYLLIQTSHM